MNTKQCIYRDCDNTNIYTPNLTFFGFPVKDAQKCNLWIELSGCDEVNFKNKYLCQNHFDPKYISKSARRTVLLPNAVPYRYNEKSAKDESYVEEDYNSEKNMSRDDILLDQLDEEMYTNTIEMLHPNEDENGDAIEEVLIEEEIQNEKEKIGPIKDTQKTYDQLSAVRNKKIDEITDKRRISTAGELVNHVTTRQKLYTSADNINVSNQMNESKKTKVENDDNNDDDETNAFDNTVGNPDITTFIFKGEEYIQMPKRIYLQQRAKLDADVKRYRHILQNIRSLVNTID